MRSHALSIVAAGAVAFIAASAAPFASDEPPARPLTGAVVPLAGDIRHISAVGELPGGRLLVTDQKMPAIWAVAAGGAATRLGSAGVGPGQYVQPGGVYPGPNRTTLVLDRAQARVLVFSPEGAFVREYSIAVQGTTGGSDADRDRQRLDAHDLAYFVDQSGGMAARLAGQAPVAATVVRFDAVRQVMTPVVTDLRLAEGRTVPAGDGVTLTRRLIGAPADGWGVAFDGRVAVVRAHPYRVDWIAADGRVTSGPVITYDVLPMTEADKAAFIANLGPGAGVGIGPAGGGRAPGAIGGSPVFAATKPAFFPDDVTVTPAGRVWVRRTGPHGATSAAHDIFDTAARRVDRVALPAAEQIVGFGTDAVYTREIAASGAETLRKYRTR